MCFLLSFLKLSCCFSGLALQGVCLHTRLLHSVPHIHLESILWVFLKSWLQFWVLSTPPPHFCWVINPCQLTTGLSSCFISGKFFRGQSKISSKWFIALRVWWLVEVLYSLGSDPSFLLKNENDDQRVSCLRRKTRIFSIELWKIHLSSKYANLLGDFVKPLRLPFPRVLLKNDWKVYGYVKHMDMMNEGFFCKAFYASVLCVLLFCILSQVCHITYWFFNLGLCQPIFWWSYPMRFGKWKYNVLSVKQCYKKGQF